jgi:hypothetical protein
MKAGKTIAYIISVIAFILAGFALVFGALAVLGSGAANAGEGWMSIGIVLMIFGLIAGVAGAGLLIFTIKKSKEAPPEQKVTLDIDLSGDIQLEKLTCEQCGGALSSKNVAMVAGAPTVECPYCGASYQLVEEPKW